MPTVPQQILDALPEPVHAADILAWAPIGAAPGTSLGETHVLVSRRAIYALSRPTPWESVSAMRLDRGARPGLLEEGFETWLILPLEEGDARIPLTAYDRKAVDVVLAAIDEHHADRVAEVPASRPPEPVVEAAPEPEPATAASVGLSTPIEPAPAPRGATFDERVDLALDTIRRVGIRAGRHGGFHSLDVSARVDDVELSVHYDRATLARLAEE